MNVVARIIQQIVFYSKRLFLVLQTSPNQLFNTGLFSTRHAAFSTKVETKKQIARNELAEKNSLLKSISNLSPGYFALVMATGIVSISAHYFGWNNIASALLYFNIVAFLVLCALKILRLIYFTEKCKSDFQNPKKSPAYLTFVAGCCVLGTELLLIWNEYFWSSVLYIAAVVVWLILIYAFFTIVTIEHRKPDIRRSISGTWLLAVVSTQAVCILGIFLAKYIFVNPRPLYFFTLVLFLCGSLFYLVLITFIMYRMSFLAFEPSEFAPSYWINMGAVAISTLAGTLLIAHAQNWDFLQTLSPFLKGFTLFFWAIGSWWIPFIVVLDIWRYIVNGLPLNYQSQNWDIVFPLGMYTVCTAELIRVMDLPFLSDIPLVFMYISLFAWGLTFLGMMRKIVLLFLHKV